LSLPYRFHPLAQQELDEAVDYLEAERPGTGLALADAVEQALFQVCEYPKFGPLVRSDIRSKLVLPSNRWHYAIFYRIKRDHIRVLAIAHHRRQPFYWLARR
jgi:plasmid stabilization system protein ParE